MSSCIEEIKCSIDQIEQGFDSMCKEVNLINESEEIQNLLQNFQKVISNNLTNFKDLQCQRKQMIENEITLQCDKEQLELELETVEEQLKLHHRHSTTDQNMLLKMMNEIETLKEENYDLSERLSEEIKKQQHTLNSINNNKTKHNINKKDIQHFIKTIEKYHCKLLSLEAVIEQLRRDGVKIPLFPTIQRHHKGIQVQNPYEDRIHNGGINPKQQEKVNELLNEINHLNVKNTEQSDELQDMNDMTQNLKKQLLHQEGEQKKLKQENKGFKNYINEQEELTDTTNKSRVMKLAMFSAFVVGMMYRKPTAKIAKMYFNL